MVLEDFTTYTEVDPSSLISKTANHIDHVALLNEDAYIWKDYGAAHFGDFEFEFEATWVSGSPTTNFAAVAFCVLSNVLDDSRWLVQNDDVICIRFRRRSGGSETIDCYVGTNGSSTVDTYEPGPALQGNTYWFTLTRVSGTVTLKIYSDAGRTSLLSTLVPAAAQNDAFQYLQGTSTWNSGSVEWLSLDFDDLDLGEIDDGSAELFAEFYIPPTGSEDLFAKFLVKQDSANLKAEFQVGQGSVDLKAVFWLMIPDSTDLFTYFEVNQENASKDLMAKAGIRRIYDLSDSGGIGFGWEGVGRGHVDIQIITPTGAWIGKFPDYANWTLVELRWADLQEVDIDGSRPDKTQITGLLWTVHSAGVRHLDSVHGLAKRPTEIFAKMVIRNIGSVDLFSEFVVSRVGGPVELFAQFRLRQDINNLKAIFEVRQGFAELKAVFEVGNVIDTYGAATDVDTDITNETSFVDMDTMEITINNVEAGDEFIIMWDGTIRRNSSGTYLCRAVYDIGAGDVPIGNELQDYVGTSNAYNGFARRLEAPSNGNYTFKIQWRMAATPAILTNRDRNMIVMHIH